MSIAVQSWLTVAGSADLDLERQLDEQVQSRIAAGKYSRDDVAYLSKMHLKLAPGTLRVSDQTLEKLRRLCQLWDVDVRPVNISSHRRVIGPLIVAAKKMVYPVLKVFMRDFINQQRNFNAAVISLLADISQERSNAVGSISEEKHA